MRVVSWNYDAFCYSVRKKRVLVLFPRATSQVAACRHLATAARVKYPAALQRCKFDTPLLAAGYLIPCILEFSKDILDFFRFCHIMKTL